METISSLWGYQDMSTEDRLLFTTLQLEQTRASAEETIRNLYQRLDITTKERDAALEKLKVILTNLESNSYPSTNNVITSNSINSYYTQHQQKPLLLSSPFPASPVPCGTSSLTADSDSHPSQLSTPSPTVSILDPTVSLSSSPELLSAPSAILPQQQPVAEYDYATALINQLASTKPLPDRGRLSQAIYECGPTLGQLLVFLKLPDYNNPPPVRQVDPVPPLSCLPFAGGMDKPSGLVGIQHRSQEISGPRAFPGPLVSCTHLPAMRREDSAGFNHLHPNKHHKLWSEATTSFAIASDVTSSVYNRENEDM